MPVPAAIPARSRLQGDEPEDPRGLLIESLRGQRAAVPRAEVERALAAYEAQRLADATPDIVEARAQRDTARNLARAWADQIAAIQAQRPELAGLSIEQVPAALLARVVELENL